MNELSARHPKFRGNWEDLRQFELLASSPIRTEQRENALRAWENYKLSRQFASITGGKKGAHMRALVNRVIDLSGADLDEVIVGYADLRGAILDDCSLKGAWLKGANLENASLRRVDLSSLPTSGRGAGRLLYSNLVGADLSDSNLSGVDLSFASLNDATLSRADLKDADLSHVTLVRANVDGAKLQHTRIYGISAWDLKGSPAIQQDLIITPEKTLGEKSYYYVLKEYESYQSARRAMAEFESEADEMSYNSAVMVDNLEVAQFIYLLLNNLKIRDIIHTVTSKAVLILGRFTDERKRVLDSLRNALRQEGYVPILFDFPPSPRRDLTETVQLLANMAKFVIADLTEAKSIPQELSHIIPFLPSVPIQPIILASEKKYGMYEHWEKFNSVLPEFEYSDESQLIGSLGDRVIKPAEAWDKQQNEVRLLKERIRELEKELYGRE